MEHITEKVYQTLGAQQMDVVVWFPNKTNIGMEIYAKWS